MTRSYSIKAHYFDASALVKLIADDPDEIPGRKALVEYCAAHRGHRYTTSYCFTEALSALKLKFLHKRIAEPVYIKYVHSLIRTVKNQIRIDEVPILWPLVFTETKRLMKKHKIDFIDCFQIVILRHGTFRHMVSNSKSILITADQRLAKAARAEDVNVWYCISEQPPSDSDSLEYIYRLNRETPIPQDAEAYQRLLDVAAQASAEEGIRQGLEDVKHGRCQPIRKFFKEFEAKHGITSSRASRPVSTKK